MRAEVRRAIVGWHDHTIRAANRMMRAMIAQFGRRRFTTAELLSHILPEPLFEVRWGRPSTPQEQELRNSIRCLTEYDFLPDCPRALGKLISLFTRRYDTEYVLLRQESCGKAYWYLREPWER